MGRGFSPFVRLVVRQIILIVALVLACRWTRDYAAYGILAAACWSSLTRRNGWAIVFYLMIPFLKILNPYLITHTGAIMVSGSVMMVAMAVFFFVSSASRRGSKTLPLGTIIPFLLCATLSSMNGYFPMISYLKLINMVVFLIGIYFATRNIDRQPKDMLLIRATFMAFACIVIYGSILTLPFPAVAYHTSAKGFLIAAGGDAKLAAMMLERSQMLSLFTGVVNHSQFLSPLTACIAGWTLFDMVAVERRLTALHGGILVLSPVVLFLTRGRAGLLAFGVMGMVAFMYVLPKLNLRGGLKRHMNNVVMIMAIAMIVAGIVMEVRNNGISRWIRKTDDVQGDSRSVTEAFTSSRMGKVELCMKDFHRNPVLGTGYQVIEEHQAMYQAGQISLFSAPIEKGVVFVMVLGETGVIGMACFLGFIFAFCGICARKKYYATCGLFIVYLSTNLAESTIFSPSGGGGIMWLLVMAGGFTIDMMAYNIKHNQNYLRRLYLAREIALE